MFCFTYLYQFTDVSLWQNKKKNILLLILPALFFPLLFCLSCMLIWGRNGSRKQALKMRGWWLERSVPMGGLVAFFGLGGCIRCQMIYSLSEHKLGIIVMLTGWKTKMEIRASLWPGAKFMHLNQLLFIHTFTSGVNEKHVTSHCFCIHEPSDCVWGAVSHGNREPTPASPYASIWKPSVPTPNLHRLHPPCWGCALRLSFWTGIIGSDWRSKEQRIRHSKL